MMELHFSVYGHGHPLVILHGLFGSSRNWVTLGKAFGRHYHVFAIDQRNHGGSPHSSVHTYESMVADLHEFLLRHGIERTHLLGHSMGGKTAMWFARTFPSMVQKLIVVDIAPRQYDSRHETIFEALTTLDLSRYRSRNDIDQALAEGIPNKRVRHFLMTNLRRNDNGKYEWRMNLPVLKREYDEIGKGVPQDRTFPGPVLFLRGEMSDLIRKEDEAFIQRIFPQSGITTIRGSGHWIHADAPELFQTHVLEFLR